MKSVSFGGPGRLGRCVTLASVSGLVGAAALWAAAPAAPPTKVTYSDAYGRTRPQPELSAADLPRFGPVEPAAARSTFTVKPGFQVELAASEPAVVSPIAIAFDEYGRLFVVEMIDYSERRDETPHAGRIRRLEDRDSDGVFETSIVFADNLPWPTAVICARGGIYVGATPDVLWLKDTNEDGRADERRVVFTGFGSGAARLNVQALINSFNWGLDHRIHGATGPIGGSVTSTAETAGTKAPLELRGLDFSFDPLTHALRPEAGGGQYGLSFNSQGTRFVCSNSDHLQAILFDLRYTARNPGVALPNPRVSIAADGPAAEVFRLSPDEPWRIVRTRWRIGGVVPGMVEGGGRVSGYFTGATGATIYRGDAYGPEFVDNAFIGDAGGNLVHRKVVLSDGVSWKARRPDDEAGVEFLASRDTWFRPVHFQNAPDGCLYVVDMYREVIEHPWSIPEAIKKHLDLNSGNDRGRIWRIVPEGFRRPKRPMPGSMETAELVAALASPNGWTRETASRLLYERQERGAIPALEQQLLQSPVPLARLHSLYALDGLGALQDEPHRLAALADPDARVREHGIRLAEPVLRAPESHAALVRALLVLADDASVRVRYQLAFTLGAFADARRMPALLKIARRDGADAWVQAAVLSALTEGAGEMFGALLPDRDFRAQPRSDAFLASLATLIGVRHQPGEVRETVAALLGATGVPGWAPLVRAMVEGAQRAGVAVTLLDPSGALTELLARARAIAGDEQVNEVQRLEAIQLLGATGWNDSGAVLQRVLQSTSEPSRIAAIQALARFPESEIGAVLLSPWKHYAARARQEVLAALSTRPERAGPLLHALENREIPVAEIPVATARALQAHREPAIAQRAAAIFPVEPTSADVLRQLQPALALPGDASRGRAVYEERCASCHRAGKAGHALGPDLVTVQTAGKEKLLASIVQPHAEVAPQYIAFQVETKQGDSYAAIIDHETPVHVTLRMANSQTLALPRTQIKGMSSSGLSLMPEGLITGLSPEAVADLLEFVLRAEPPAKTD